MCIKEMLSCPVSSSPLVRTLNAVLVQAIPRQSPWCEPAWVDAQHPLVGEICTLGCVHMAHMI
jgi:hypothetical protein